MIKAELAITMEIEFDENQFDSDTISYFDLKELFEEANKPGEYYDSFEYKILDSGVTIISCDTKKQ